MQVASSNLSNHIPAQGQAQRWRRDWHSESDIADRRQLIHHMYVAICATERWRNEALAHKRCYLQIPAFDAAQAQRHSGVEGEVARFRQKARGSVVSRGSYEGEFRNGLPKLGVHKRGFTTTDLLQEEYVNTTSLEQRLQNVARTFVSQRPRQQSQQPQSRPGSAGLPQQMPYLNSSFSSSNTPAPFTQANFAAMMPNAAPQRPDSAGPGQSSQQHSGQLPNGQAQGTQLQNTQRHSLSHASPVLADQPGPVSSMPMASQSMTTAQSPVQNRDQQALVSPSLAQADSNAGMNLAAQQQAAMLRSQQGPTTNGPLMSNGKPALLRGAAARDGAGWAQGPAMVSVHSSHCG